MTDLWECLEDNGQNIDNKPEVMFILLVQVYVIKNGSSSNRPEHCGYEK